jgi:putative transposase
MGVPKRPRQAVGGLVYHVLNRGCGRMRLFSRDRDYAAFERVLLEALARDPMRLLSFCLMPNHWHLVLWPRADGQLSRFMHWLTMTHTQRWRHTRKLVGLGPLYQGRFRAFAVEADDHYLTLCRYVERNPLRAGLVKRAQDWTWSSLHVRLSGDDGRRGLLSPWPVDEPQDWLDWVNLPQTNAELERLHSRIRTGRPLGSPAWEKKIAPKLGYSATQRPRGRPKGRK